MSNGHYLYAFQDNVNFLKLDGKLTFDICAGFESVISQILTQQPPHPVIVDLQEAEYLDSTNLGLLARIAAHSIELMDRKLTIVSSSKDINRLLVNIGFEQISVIVPSSNEPESKLEEIPGLTINDKETSRILLTAHKTLMEMNETNREMFADVVSLL